MTNILIVEDQAPMRKQLRDFVQLACPQAQVAEAADGSAALAACAAHPPDVALVDIELPDFDGMALIGYLRAQHPHVRVIVVSHHAERIYLEAAAAAGAFGYVIKENVAAELLLLLARALASDRRGPGGAA